MKSKLVFAFVLFLACVASMLCYHQTMENIELVHKYNTIKAEQVFDTTAINDWCGDCSDGNVRMVGAVASGDILEDDAGNLWAVDLPLMENEFYLVWLADNFTEDLTDDIVIKVWMEAH